MSRSHYLLLVLSVFAISPAHAIPPPDVVVSVWQSVLQLAGVASVFLAGTFFALRQIVEQYLGRWLRPVMLGLLLLGLTLIGWLLFAPAAHAAPPAAPIKAELIPIETVIRRETDTWVRDWKLQTLREMKQEANLTRQRKQLPVVKFSDIPSFTPAELNRLLKSRVNEVYLLDIREDFERSQFRINHQAVFRYGDLVQDVLPTGLPKDKMIVVLCHSGLRGYMGASFLQRGGFQQVSFLRGGLAEWNREKYPVTGHPDYKAKRETLLDKTAAKTMDALKVQVDADGTRAVKLPGLIHLPYETASSADLQPVLQAAGTRPVLLVCKTYGGCFHSTNLAWLIKHQGGIVAGIYDESGKHMRSLQQ